MVLGKAGQPFHARVIGNGILSSIWIIGHVAAKAKQSKKDMVPAAR